MVNGRSLCGVNDWMVCECPSSSTVKSSLASLPAMSPCLSRTTARLVIGWAELLSAVFPEPEVEADPLPASCWPRRALEMHRHSMKRTTVRSCVIREVAAFGMDDRSSMLGLNDTSLCRTQVELLLDGITTPRFTARKGAPYRYCARLLTSAVILRAVSCLEGAFARLRLS